MSSQLNPVRLSSTSLFCARLSTFPPHPPRPGVSPFHTSQTRRAASSDHYETLGLSPSASQADIKKQYYTLSKTTHPDRNPDDPNAAARFSAVSEAYSTLGNVDKRARYDREVMPRRGSSSSAASRSGSYSSAQAGPNGSRPASGLSRRRSPFQGPPPSFYKSGGYGAYADRAAHEEQNAQSARRRAGQDYDPEGWTAGGAQRSGVFDDDVPHFDRDAHYRTQETVIGKTAGRKRRLYRDQAGLESATGMSSGASFFVVAFVVGLAMIIPAMVMSNTSGQQNKKKGEG